MNIKENEYVTPQELGDLGKPLKEITFKPKLTIYVVMAISVVLCITMIWPLVVLGVFFLLMAWYVSVNLPDRKVMDIYQGFLVIYEVDSEKVRKINFEEIEEWSCKAGKSGADSIMLRLTDGEVLYKDTFIINKAYRCLMKLLKEKESRAITERVNKGSKLVFRNPFKKK